MNNLDTNIKELTDTFGEEKIKNIPSEILLLGKEAIRNYLEQLENEETVQLFEAKVMLVGYGNVGKTSLVKRMLDNDFDKDEQMTIGINIRHWTFANENTSKFRINVWDFSGQEINYPTHQFFLTKRSVYVKVWYHRQYTDLPNRAFFDYWLNIAKLMGENSPIIVVQNKIDERFVSIPQNDLYDSFPIVQFVETSAKDGRGVAELKLLIESEVSKLQHIGDSLPVKWLDIRNELESRTEPYISLSIYYEICHKHGLNTQQALHLSDYFHDLGVFVHFKHSFLKDLIILKFEWINNAVYRIINDQQIQRNWGRLEYNYLRQVWNDYPEEKIPHLLEIMKKFEMCLELPNGQYLVPELLKDMPRDTRLPKAETLRFEYWYRFVPAGLISRFIAQVHRAYSSMIKECWKIGVWLEYEKTQALIRIEEIDRKINISIIGEKPKALRSIIQSQFDEIHKSLNIENGKTGKIARFMVPCLCKSCVDSENPHYFEMAKIEHFKNEFGLNYTMQCQISGINVPLEKLLKLHNGNEIQTELHQSIVKSCADLLQNQTIMGISEDNRTAYIYENLRLQNRWKVSFQEHTGISNKKAGETDIMIRNLQTDNLLTIVEAFKLKTLDSNVIHSHIDKLINRYNQAGITETYMLIYAESNDYEQLWQKYIHFLQTNLIGNTSLQTTEKFTTHSNIKLCETEFTQHGKSMKMIHLFLNFKTLS